MVRSEQRIEEGSEYSFRSRIRCPCCFSPSDKIAPRRTSLFTLKSSGDCQIKFAANHLVPRIYQKTTPHTGLTQTPPNPPFNQGRGTIFLWSLSPDLRGGQGWGASVLLIFFLDTHASPRKNTSHAIRIMHRLTFAPSASTHSFQPPRGISCLTV